MDKILEETYGPSCVYQEQVHQIFITLGGIEGLSSAVQMIMQSARDGDVNREIPT